MCYWFWGQVTNFTTESKKADFRIYNIYNEYIDIYDIIFYKNSIYIKIGNTKSQKTSDRF